MRRVSCPSFATLVLLPAHLPNTPTPIADAPLAIWRFTLYWTLLLVCGTYFICASIATISLLLSLTYLRPLPPPIAPKLQPPTPLTSLATPRPRRASHSGQEGQYEMGELNDMGRGGRSGQAGPAPDGVTGGKRLSRPKRARPPLWPVLLIPAIAVVVSALIALGSATVIGFALAALYSAGGFSMST